MSRYGRRHRAIRQAMLPFAIGKPCPHCGEPMRADQALHLDHTADGRGYRGFAHKRCNEAEGGRRGRAAQLRRRGGVFPA